MRVAISHCLLGAPVRYDGGSKPVSEVMELAEKVEVVRRGKVRRAKLFYLRERTGKAAKVKARI